MPESVEPPASFAPERPLFAAPAHERQPVRGISLWFVAAVSLVLGIGIGFASGYQTGQGRAAGTAAIDEASPASTSGSGSSAGRPFSESTVESPVRVDEPPVVEAPSPKPDTAAARRPPAPAPTPVPTPTPRSAPAASPTAATAAPTTVPSASPAAAAPRAAARPAPEPSVPAAAVTGPATLEIVSRPAGAEVFLDGRSVGRTPLSMADVPVGSHEVRIELAGFNRWATRVDVKAGNATRVAASLEQ